FGAFKDVPMDQLPDSTLTWIVSDKFQVNPRYPWVKEAAWAVLEGQPYDGPAEAAVPKAYTAHLEERMGRGKWFPVCNEDVQALGLEQSALLSYLLSLGRAFADPKGWVEVWPRVTQKATGFSPEKQGQLLRLLDEQGVVELRV